MVDKLKERSTGSLTITFKDKSGNAENPTSSRYKINEPKTNKEIRAWTVLSPSVGVVTITLTPADNTLVTTQLLEDRVVTVDADYGDSDGVNSAFKYQIEALEFLGSTE